MEPAVTVIIPTYNRSKSVIGSMESVLNQSFRGLELIVVDDCSADDTVEIIKSLDDPRIRLIEHEENKGAAAARNTGIENARGHYVAFQDSDDEWFADKLEKQIKRIQDRPCVGAYCGMIIENELDNPDRIAKTYFPDKAAGRLEGEIHEHLLRRSFISTQTLLTTRINLERIGRFDESLRALIDWDLVIRLSKLGHIAFIDEPLVIQRFSENSITRSARNRLYARKKIVQKYLPDMKQNPGLLASHYHAIAGGHRLLGEPRASISYLWEAIRLRPSRVRSWLSLLSATLQIYMNKSGNGK